MNIPQSDGQISMEALSLFLFSAIHQSNKMTGIIDKITGNGNGA
jgi:hypothetical protein